MSKQFVYTVDFRFKDEYGNRFPLPDDGIPFFLSIPLSVIVSVSEEKQNHQSAANSEFWGFVTATALALFAGIDAALTALYPGTAALAAGLAAGAAAAGAAAAALNAASQGDSGAANDPIYPDFNLRTYAQTPPISLPKGFAKEKTYPQTRRLLRMLHMVRGAEDVIYSTLPRILGANISNDHSAFEKQIRHCEKALADIRTACEQLQHVAGLAAREFNSLILKHEKRIDAAMLQVKMRGIDAEIKEQLLDFGIPNNLVSYVEDAIRDDSFPKCVVELKDRKTSIQAIGLTNVATARIRAAQSVSRMAVAFIGQFKDGQKRRNVAVRRNRPKGTR